MSNKSRNSDSGTSCKRSSVSAPLPEPPPLPAAAKSTNSSGPPADSLDSAIEAFGALFLNVRQSLKNAANLFTAIVDRADGEGYTMVMKRFPDLTRRTLERLEAIGRGRILPSLALDASYGAGCLSRLPVRLQKKYDETPVPVVKKIADGMITEFKPVRELSVNECRQVFDTLKHDIRDEDAQKELLRAHRIEVRPRWEVLESTGEIIFHEETRLNAAQLEAIVNHLKEAMVRALPQAIRERSGGAQMAGNDRTA